MIRHPPCYAHFFCPDSWDHFIELEEGDELYVDIFVGEKGKRGVNITYNEEITDDLICAYERNLLQNINNIRFPVSTIWNNGHSMSESNVPNSFRCSIHQGINTALLLINDDKCPDSLVDELFFFLCCLHKDTPKQITDILLRASREKEGLIQHHRKIAFAIGAAELSWQKQLLENVIDPVDDEGLTRSITMVMLAIVFWRSRSIIHTQTFETIQTLTDKLIGCLEYDYNKILKKTDELMIRVITKHLELLLALLRTRESTDNKISSILAPDRDITKRFSVLVDKITDLCIAKKMKPLSRIKLEINKPNSLHNTPDLFYALHLYLTGDTGAKAISIIGVSDGDAKENENH